MASRSHRVLPRLDAMEPERPPPALVSELLEEIFLRVASPADLARASAACVSFRRLIADPSFLRRYRSIHPPQLLGVVSCLGFHRVQAPHPSATVARAVAFSFDFLPHTTERDRWQVRDVRDGRVLVLRRNDKSPIYRDIAVCDPLSRRYLLLPPITDNLLASVGLQNQDFDQWGTSFISSGDIDEDTSFSLIHWVRSDTMLGVFVFSSASGCWSVSMSTNCNDLGLNELEKLVSGQWMHDCFYWKLECMSMLIKLDMNTTKFCTVDLPSGHSERQIVIVESGRNKVAMFSVDYAGTSVDYYTFSQRGSENSHGWHMTSTIPLPEDYIINRCYFKGPTEGYIFLKGVPMGHNPKDIVFFSLEIKSFKIERFSTTGFAPHYYFFLDGHPYFGFPPFMSPVRI